MLRQDAMWLRAGEPGARRGLPEQQLLDLREPFHDRIQLLVDVLELRHDHVQHVVFVMRPPESFQTLQTAQALTTTLSNSAARAGRAAAPRLTCFAPPPHGSRTCISDDHTNT